MEMLGINSGCPTTSRPGDASLRPGEIINLDDVLAVGCVSELEAEHLSIGARLLNRIGSRFIACLCLDDRKRKIPSLAQQIINPLGRLSNEAFLADGDYTSVRDGALFGWNGDRYPSPVRVAWEQHISGRCHPFSERNTDVPCHPYYRGDKLQNTSTLSYGN